MLMSLPPKRLKRYQEAVKEAFRWLRRTNHCHSITCADSSGVPRVHIELYETRLRLNTMLEAVKTAISDPFNVCRLPQIAVNDLTWWSERSSVIKPIRKPLPAETYDTDASESGWGAVHYPSDGKGKLYMHGRWPAQTTTTEPDSNLPPPHTSNQRELTAISEFEGLRTLAIVQKWNNCTVQVRTGVTVLYQPNGSGTDSHASIHRWALERN